MLEFKVLKMSESRIETNFQALKKDLEIQLLFYQDFKVSEDAISNAKSTRANLNKVITMIDERRKEIKKDLLKPYEVVENQAKELISMVNNVVGTIDSQLKTFALKEKEQKLEEVKKIWDDLSYTKISFSDILKSSWLLKSTSLAQVKKDMENQIDEIENNIGLITIQIEKEMTRKMLIEKYLDCLDYNAVMDEYQKNKEIAEKIRNKEKKTIPIAEQQTTKQEANFEVTLRIVATREKLVALSNYMKQNNYIYERIQ